MPNQIQVIVPKSEAERVLALLHSIDEAFSVSSFEGEHNKLILLRTTEKRTEGVIRQLQGIGVGVQYGVIDILMCATLPLLGESRGVVRKKRQYRLDDRQSLALIVDQVDSSNHLTFNYVMFILVAGIIAAVGLSTNSPATVVASMLVSPLMGPIMAITLGTAIRDVELIRKGLRNEGIGIAITLGVGLGWGFSVAWWPQFWNQGEQLSRGTLEALYLGVVVAIPSGAGVALATSQGGGVALVGVAISAALLPPVCNAGSQLAYGLVLLGRPDVNPATTSTIQLWQALYSFCLFLINLVCIFLTALLFFRIKGVTHNYISLKRSNTWQDPESIGSRGRGGGVASNRDTHALLLDVASEGDDSGGDIPAYAFH